MSSDYEDFHYSLTDLAKNAAALSLSVLEEIVLPWVVTLSVYGVGALIVASKGFNDPDDMVIPTVLALAGTAAAAFADTPMRRVTGRMRSCLGMPSPA